MQRPLVSATLILVAALLAWTIQRAGGQSNAVWGFVAVGAAALIVVLLIRRPKPRRKLSPKERERAAHFMVSKMLGTLTRVQVAYLHQTFDSVSDGEAWLKNALPRGYRDATKSLREDLDQARDGDAPPSARLPSRVIALQRELAPIDQALDKASENHKDHAIGTPVVFVITEKVDEETDEPLVVSLAGWNCNRPTLLGEVDVLTLFYEADGTKQVRGQIALEKALEQLSDFIKPLAGHKGLYRAMPIEGTMPAGAELADIPIGFVVGTSEFLS